MTPPACRAATRPPRYRTTAQFSHKEKNYQKLDFKKSGKLTDHSYASNSLNVKVNNLLANLELKNSLKDKSHKADYYY